MATADLDPSWERGEVNNAAAETPAYASLQSRLAGPAGGFFLDISDVAKLDHRSADMLVLPPMRGATFRSVERASKDTLPKGMDTAALTGRVAPGGKAWYELAGATDVGRLRDSGVRASAPRGAAACRGTPRDHDARVRRRGLSDGDRHAGQASGRRSVTNSQTEIREEVGRGLVEPPAVAEPQFEILGHQHVTAEADVLDVEGQFLA